MFEDRYLPQLLEACGDGLQFGRFYQMNCVCKKDIEIEFIGDNKNTASFTFENSSISSLRNIPIILELFNFCLEYEVSVSIVRKGDKMGNVTWKFSIYKSYDSGDVVYVNSYKDVSNIKSEVIEDSINKYKEKLDKDDMACNMRIACHHKGGYILTYLTHSCFYNIDNEFNEGGK